MTSTRTALYYPNMVIPNKLWTRQALLYWDDIGSIIPEVVWRDHEFFKLENEEINQLFEAKLFRPFFPETLKRKLSSSTEDRFYDEFYDRVDYFKTRNTFDLLRSATPIYELKEIRPGFFDELAKRGLATRNIGKLSQVSESGHNVFFVETNTANIYMALLAEYLSGLDNNITVPVTEDATWQNYGYSTTDPTIQNVCANLILDRILPVPAANTPIVEIIQFKKDHKSELIRFRKSVDDFQASIPKAGDIRSIQDSCCKFSEEIGAGVRDIEQSLVERNIDTFFGSLETILDVKSPEISGALISSGALTLGTGQPLFLLTGLVAGASIKVERYLLKERSDRRRWLENLPYSYVYHLQQSGFVQQR